VAKCAIHGSVVNVLDSCLYLPTLPSEAQIVPIKLKRKLGYKGHYVYQYIQPAKVVAAWQWLKANNVLYKYIRVNSNWFDDASQDDSDL